MATVSTSTWTTDDGNSLPQLSSADYKVYDHMAEHMNYFHHHFRQDWDTLYSAACTGKRPLNTSVKQYISAGLSFCQNLELHHNIEEQHIFPVLAKKMPAFRKELELLTQHKQIHVGMDRLEEYLNSCLTGETDFRMSEIKTVMDSFREVLWSHLDDEVKQLRAENMRKYWTLEEMRRMPM